MGLTDVLSDILTLTSLSVTFNLLEPQTESKQEMDNNNYNENISINSGK